MNIFNNTMRKNLMIALRNGQKTRFTFSAEEGAKKDKRGKAKADHNNAEDI